jgi:hypothetical protein
MSARLVDDDADTASYVDVFTPPPVLIIVVQPLDDSDGLDVTCLMLHVVDDV